MGELHKNYIGGEWVEGEPVANLKSFEYPRGSRPLCTGKLR